MLDDEFQLPVLRRVTSRIRRWRHRGSGRSSSPSRATPTRPRSAGSGDSRTRLALLLRELAVVAAETRPYADDPKATNLVSFVKRDSTHWRSASWRDSDAGYANGRFAMDINAIWAPQALEGIAAILAALPRLGVTAATLDSLAPGAADGPLGAWLRDPGALRSAIDTWKGARRHFVVTLAPTDVRDRIRRRLATLPDADRRYWTGTMAGDSGLTDSLSFLALSLDSAGRPIPVVNTDPATDLFLDAAAGASDRARDEIGPFLRPYPAGLFVPRLGPLVANDAYATASRLENLRRRRLPLATRGVGPRGQSPAARACGPNRRLVRFRRPTQRPRARARRARPRRRTPAHPRRGRRLGRRAQRALELPDRGRIGSSPPATAPAPTSSSGVVPISRCSSPSPGCHDYERDAAHAPHPPRAGRLRRDGGVLRHRPRRRLGHCAG